MQFAVAEARSQPSQRRKRDLTEESQAMTMAHYCNMHLGGAALETHVELRHNTIP